MTAPYFPHRLAADVTIGKIPTFDYPKVPTQFGHILMRAKALSTALAWTIRVGNEQTNTEQA